MSIHTIRKKVTNRYALHLRLKSKYGISLGLSVEHDERHYFVTTRCSNLMIHARSILRVTLAIDSIPYPVPLPNAVGRLMVSRLNIAATGVFTYYMRSYAKSQVPYNPCHRLTVFNIYALLYESQIFREIRWWVSRGISPTAEE